MGRQAPAGAGRHPHQPARDRAGRPPAGGHRAGTRGARTRSATFRATGFGYFLEQATRPQTIGYALLDSPVALAAWMLDHDTDSYDKISRAFLDGQPAGHLTRDTILDNITLYWLTGTGASAARAYWESGRAQALPPPARPRRRSRSRSASPPSPARSSGPRAAGSSTRTPPSPTSTRSTRGGHFAAWEEPQALLLRAPRRLPVAALDDRVRTCAHALARRGDRVAQLRATRPRRAARATSSS